MTDGNLIDRRHAQFALYREAEKSYEVATGERMAHWQRRLLARYARNLALADHALIPGVFDLTVAARAIADYRQLRLGGLQETAGGAIRPAEDCERSPDQRADLR